MPFFNSHTRKAAISSLLSRMMESLCGGGSPISVATQKCRGAFNLWVIFLLCERRCGTATTLRFSSSINNRSDLKALRGIFASLALLPKRGFDISRRARLQQRTFGNGIVTFADDTDGDRRATALGFWDAHGAPRTRG